MPRCAECGGTTNVRHFIVQSGKVLISGVAVGSEVDLCAMHFPRRLDFQLERNEWQPSNCRFIRFEYNPRYHRVAR